MDEQFLVTEVGAAAAYMLTLSELASLTLRILKTRNFRFLLPGQDHAMLLESLLLLNTPTFFKTFLEDQALPALGALQQL